MLKSVVVDFINLETEDTFMSTVEFKKHATYEREIITVYSKDPWRLKLHNRSKVLGVVFYSDKEPRVILDSGFMAVSEIEDLDVYTDYVSVKYALKKDDLDAKEQYYVSRFLEKQPEKYDVEVIKKELRELMLSYEVGYVADQEMMQNVKEVEGHDLDSFVILGCQYEYERFEAFWKTAEIYLGGLEVAFAQFDNMVGNRSELHGTFRYYAVTPKTAYRLYKHFYKILDRMPGIDLDYSPDELTDSPEYEEIRKFIRVTELVDRHT